MSTATRPVGLLWPPAEMWRQPASEWIPRADLKMTGRKLGFRLDFAREVGIKRKVFDL